MLPEGSAEKLLLLFSGLTALISRSVSWIFFGKNGCRWSSVSPDLALFSKSIKILLYASFKLV
jgi:hypothetical protein